MAMYFTDAENGNQGKGSKWTISIEWKRDFIDLKTLFLCSLDQSILSTLLPGHFHTPPSSWRMAWFLPLDIFQIEMEITMDWSFFDEKVCSEEHGWEFAIPGYGCHNVTSPQSILNVQRV